MNFSKELILKENQKKISLLKIVLKKVELLKKKAQNDVDTKVKKAVDGVPMMKEYLRNRFALKSGDKPHLMKFQKTVKYLKNDILFPKNKQP